MFVAIWLFIFVYLPLLVIFFAISPVVGVIALIFLALGLWVQYDKGKGQMVAPKIATCAWCGQTGSGRLYVSIGDNHEAAHLCYACRNTIPTWREP